MNVFCQNCGARARSWRGRSSPASLRGRWRRPGRGRCGDGCGRLRGRGASWPFSTSNCVPQSISCWMRSGASRTTISTTSRSQRFAAGDQRVGDVVLEAVFGIDHAGDAALGIGAVGLLHRVLGDHEHREPRIDRHRRPQPGEAAADHQHVDEVVRNPLGMKRHEIAGHGEGSCRPFYSSACRARETP